MNGMLPKMLIKFTVLRFERLSLTCIVCVLSLHNCSVYQLYDKVNRNLQHSMFVRYEPIEILATFQHDHRVFFSRQYPENSKAVTFYFECFSQAHLYHMIITGIVLCIFNCTIRLTFLGGSHYMH